MYTELFSEVHAVLQALEPQAVNTDADTLYVDMANYHRAVLVLSIGSTSGDVEVELLQCDSDVDDTNEMPIGAWGGDKEAFYPDSGAAALIMIELRTEELDVDNGFHYIGVHLDTSDGGGANVSYILYGIAPRFMPVATTLIEEVVP